MIMNYVLSFCKITAASRIFSRNFYLPLLKPLTPKDALRTFKITGKWLLGSKIQHYIPVLGNHKKKRSKRIKNYGKLAHKYDDSFTYMAPIFDDDNESHARLKKIIESKATPPSNENPDCLFIYTVDDKMCNIVFPGKFELAIRDGDIIDVLVSQSDDKVLIKLKDFKKIPISLRYYDRDDLGEPLMKGEGATTEDEERFHHHGKATMKLAKIFEAKEMAEEWEHEMMKIVARKKKQKGEGTREWQEMVSQTIENINWQQFEVEAKKVIDQIWEPAREEHIGMVVEDLEKTRNVSDFFASDASRTLLPSLTEIPDVVKNMVNAVYEELEDENGNRIAGVRVTLSNGKEVFVTGQMVKTDEGDVFVPGQTIENEFGLSYAPGMTVMLDGKPQLIKGLIMGEQQGGDGDGAHKPMFLPTESSITADGALTFCRNPEELSKAQPHKIFVKRKKEKGGKKKKRKSSAASAAEEQSAPPITNGVSSSMVLEEPQPAALDDILSMMDGFQVVVVNDLDVIVESEEPDDSVPLCEEDEEVGMLVEVIPVIEPIITIEAVTEKTQSEEDLDEFIKLERLVELQELHESDSEHKAEDDEDKEPDGSQKSTDDFSFKHPDDGMDKLIEDIEDKKSELQKKLEELRRLSVILDNSVTYVQIEDAECMAGLISSQPDQQYKIAEVLMTLTRRASTFRERMKVNVKNIENLAAYTPQATTTNSFLETDIFDQTSTELKRSLMIALHAGNEVFKTRPKDQMLALKTITAVLQNEFHDGKTQMEELCSRWLDRDELCVSTLRALTQKVRECRVHLLKSLCTEYDADKCGDVLEHSGVLAAAFKTLAKNSPEVCDALRLELQTRIDDVHTEVDAREALQHGIRDACAAYADDLLAHFNVHDDVEYEEVTQEARGLAGTLGMWEVEDTLGDRARVLALLKSSTTGGDCGWQRARDFLRRFLLIRELCHKDYSMKTSLERIRKHPECGRTDPRIRQLLIKSASLLSRQRDLRSSLEIPLQLFKEQNFVAIEDCVYMKCRVDAPLLVSRKGIQAVVPREAEAGVLAGRVPYTLVDESGVTSFKPMHMFKMARHVRRNSLSDARMAA